MELPLPRGPSLLGQPGKSSSFATSRCGSFQPCSLAVLGEAQLLAPHHSAQRTYANHGCIHCRCAPSLPLAQPPQGSYSQGGTPDRGGSQGSKRRTPPTKQGARPAWHWGRQQEGKTRPGKPRLKP